jgi:ribosome-associated heat shock protein Hsp15
MPEPTNTERVRLDKFLWAARFFKTRQLAVEQIDKGRVQVNGQIAKAGRELHVGDMLVLRQAEGDRSVRVRQLSAVRGPASIAQTLYEETPESIAARERAAQARRLAPEPALSQTKGRPTKRDRREIDRASGHGGQKGWGERWSVSIND